MKNIILIAILCLCSITTFAIETVELPLPKSDKIVVKFMFQNGSICDGPDEKGITALTASLMAEGGTGTYTSSGIKDITYPWAARWNVTVDKEVSVFTFEFHKDHAEKIMPFMMGLITKPSLTEADFNRIKSNQENFVNQVIRASSDEEFSKMGLEDFLFRSTNYQTMVEGTTSGLDKISLTKVQAHFKDYFAKSNLTIGIAGNYSPNYLTQIKESCSSLSEKSKDLPDFRVSPITLGINVEIITKENALGSAIFTGFPLAVTRKDDVFAALMVANSWLGEHRKSYSRLYKKIREERSMNYGDYSYIEWYENGGQNMLPQPGYPRSTNYFSIWIRPVQTAEALKKQYPELGNISVGHAHFALRMALKEMQTFIDNGMSNEDFELTRKFLLSYTKLYIQTPAKQLGFLMDSKFYGRNDYIKDLETLLNKVTVDDVNRAMKKHWQTQNMQVTIVTDDSEAEALKESLMRNQVSPMTYSDALKATLPDYLLSEDDEVAKYKLNVTNVEIVKSDSMFR